MKSAFIARPHQLGVVFLTLLIPFVGPFVFITMLFTYFFYTNPRQRLNPLPDHVRKRQWKTLGIWSLALFAVFYIFLLGIPQMLLVHGWSAFS